MECQTPIYLHKQDMVVPCGKCVFCGASKRSDWALRLFYEGKQHLVKKFVTLTYADCHLHWKHGQSQLYKRDIQLWLKRIRAANGKVRYFAVGEYGSKTYRPHYHVLLFGDVSDELIRDSWRKEGQKGTFERGDILGHVHIGNVTHASIMYCLGYIVNGKGWKMRHRREAPFALMSRRPGLGANYLTEAMVDWHRSGRKNYALLDGAKRHLPRYYKQKIFSKIDLVRIAVRDQKQVFKNSVKWLRSAPMRRLPDPLGYRKIQIERLAKKIRSQLKENLTI